MGDIGPGNFFMHRFSAVFVLLLALLAFAAPAQAATANASRTAAQTALGRPFVTPVRGPARFWPAEAEHQNYAETHRAHYEAYKVGCRRTESLRRVWGQAAVV
jgi:peptide-methionine (S)-S-oxide reductase